MLSISSPYSMSAAKKKGQIKMHNIKLIKSESTGPSPSKKVDDFTKKDLAIE